MPQLSADAVIIEQMVEAAIRDTLMSVPLIVQFCQVHMRERFADNDETDIAVSTVADPVNADVPMTSIIQIGLPTVSEKAYTSEDVTTLILTYPITFDIGVKDEWDNSNGALEYSNSKALAMAIYMKARQAFKKNLTLGFENCQHEYLQQDSAATVEEPETGGWLHTFDWSLSVIVKGITV